MALVRAARRQHGCRPRVARFLNGGGIASHDTYWGGSQMSFKRGLTIGSKSSRPWRRGFLLSRRRCHRQARACTRWATWQRTPQVYSEKDLVAFVQSPTAKTVVQDVETGQFSKVTVGESVSPMIVSRAPCSATDLCLRPTQTPYANYGFYGAGTKTGTWSNRASWYTGSWSGRVKTSNGVWSGGCRVRTRRSCSARCRSLSRASRSSSPVSPMGAGPIRGSGPALGLNPGPSCSASLACSVGCAVAGVGEAVGVGAGLDDVAAEGEPVDDGGAEPGVGEGLGPAGEGLVGGDRDASSSPPVR